MCVFTLFSLLLTAPPYLFSFFFFNDTATTEIYTLSLHDALPIYHGEGRSLGHCARAPEADPRGARFQAGAGRSEEHTSELQSPCNLVCRLLLEKKKKTKKTAVIENTQHELYESSTATAQTLRYYI